MDIELEDEDLAFWDRHELLLYALLVPSLIWSFVGLISLFVIPTHPILGLVGCALWLAAVGFLYGEDV